MLNFDEITAELVQARVCKLIRRHIKESKQTYAEIAEILDVDQRTLEAWARSETAPKLYHYKRLVQFFGPAFCNEDMELIGMSGLHLIEKQPTNAQQLLTNVMGVGRDISKALEDGHIDHKERAELKPILKRIQKMPQPLQRLAQHLRMQKRKQQQRQQVQVQHQTAQMQQRQAQ